MKSDQHNYMLYDRDKKGAVVSGNSHAVSYTYVSSRLLYLKAHYPMEFFAAVLSCEDNEDKLREYKLDAEQFGIKIKPLDLNQSGVNFEIRGNEIYIGFSNVKGIGESVAKKIVEGQPYASFVDFLTRFGTDANTIKPLIGLRVFGDDPISLYEFYEHFKKESKKRQDREIRNLKRRQEHIDEFQAASMDLDSEIIFNKLLEGQELEVSDDLVKIVKKYKKCVEGYENKVLQDAPIMDNFVPTGDIKDVELKKIYEDDILASEEKWYGFGFVHPLLKSVDYQGGMTFDDFQIRMESTKKDCGPVEARVCDRPKKMKAKNGSVYYIVWLDDANFQKERITIWDDDYERFKEEFEYWEENSSKGNLFRIRLQASAFPYRGYKFESPPRHKRNQIAANKKDDWRLILMSRGDTKAEVLNKLKELAELSITPPTRGGA